MFAVYNNGSVKFRSTSDNLYELKNVDQAAESRHKPDDDRYQAFDDFLDKKNTNKKDAIDAYKKVANMDTSSVIYHVSQIMTQNCVTANIDATLIETYDILKENAVSQIPIVSAGNKIVGMIDKKIILNLLLDDFDNGKNTLNKKLSDIELNQLITTDPISDIRRVAKVMISCKVDAIPVVNQSNILVGIVSKTDIINAVSHIPELHLWA